VASSNLKTLPNFKVLYLVCSPASCEQYPTEYLGWISFFQLTNVQDPPLCLEEELSMLVMQGATWLTLLESISGHTDFCRISCLNTSPKELVLTCSMHESWEGWEKMTPGAQKERGVGPPGNAGSSWNSRTCWPEMHNKNPNQLQVAGSCKDWQRASPSLKLALLLGPWGLQQRFQLYKEISGKEASPPFFIYYRHFHSSA